MPSGIYKNRNWLWLAAFVIILDQVTKYLAVAHLSYGQPMVLTPFFNLTLAFNRGAAFSFLSNSTGWQRWFFAGIAILVIIYVFMWLFRLPKKNYWLACALCLIIGGAAGNLIDRVIHGYVIDFIQVHYQQWYWPDFNIADSAVCIGAFMLIVSLVFKK